MTRGATIDTNWVVKGIAAWSRPTKAADASTASTVKTETQRTAFAQTSSSGNKMTEFRADHVHFTVSQHDFFVLGASSYAKSFHLSRFGPTTRPSSMWHANLRTLVSQDITWYKSMDSMDSLALLELDRFCWTFSELCMTCPDSMTTSFLACQTSAWFSPPKAEVMLACQRLDLHLLSALRAFSLGARNTFVELSISMWCLGS